MDTAFLWMKNISKRYTGVQALDSVNFEIKKGEIHCLAGTNGSGKSTLIKIISGVEKPDLGSQIYINGELSSHRTSIDSIHQGIEVIYQDLSLFPNLSVAENIALGSLISGKKKLLSRKGYYSTARKAMKKINVNIALDQKVEDLSIADQQLVAICRSLTGELNLLIMDEPTTALTSREVDALLRVVIDLKDKGIATLFVSHKLNEVMQIAQRVTILKDGKKVGCYPAVDLDSQKIEFFMTGANFQYKKNTTIPSPSRKKPLLEIKNLSKKQNYNNISLKLYPGEILGITGLLGSGRTELAHTLFGMNPADDGSIKINDKKIVLNSVFEAIDLGIAYVPENRLVQGLVLNQTVSKNSVITIIRRLLKKTGLIDHKNKADKITDLVNKFSIKVPSIDAPVSTLSGGNQQRVVLAKWVATDPKLLILDGPTVGIDVAAKGSIHESISQLAAEGLGVILISDEVPEVLNICHRVFVMNRGRIISEFITSESTEEDVLRCLESID
ncbi:MAG: lipase [Desulfobacteraceae bacterium 4572_89]|nr:MAG: lipase [Desulfobacteraceae bacterium 4572_89]